MKKAKVFQLILVIIIFALGSLAGYLLAFKKTDKPLSPGPKNQYLAFLNEVYETVQKNYWDQISDEDLGNLYLLGIEKLSGQPQNLEEINKENLQKLIEKILKQIDEEEKKKEFTTALADMVLANLKPFGRSRLYTQKDETALSKTVKNITETDHYQALDVSKEASQEEIQSAYQKQLEALGPEKEASPEAQEKIAQTKQAFKVLSDEDNRQTYDQSGVEPTFDWQILFEKILHLHLKKFSPTTLEEFQRLTAKLDENQNLDTLIFDLRDNIGGAIDYLPVFLGPFIGKDQYAYQFFHQGEKTDFKTKTGWLASLVRYKKVVILINENSQSSAEIVASVLKKYNVGIVVGTTTKGWGTVERVFPMEQQLDSAEKHSIFLVHSLTLREDGQPIEENGVEPLININKTNWQDQLNQYFHYPNLIKAVEQIFTS